MNKNKLLLGQKLADKITRIVGSWTFLIVQSVLLIFWVALNVIAWKYRWDPYPFIFLNLALSFQAAYTAPIILMSENREIDRGRKKSIADLATDRKAEREISQIQMHLFRLEQEKIDQILKILNENNNRNL